MTPAASAFLAKHAARITRDPVYGCYLWADATRKSGGLDKDGYGVIWSKDGPRQAHREVYRELVGDPGPGKVLDHLCRRRNCVRPAHLEPVKGSENDLRRSWRYRCRRARCKNGHDLSTCITTEFGGRLCRVCQGPERDPMSPALAVTPEMMRASFDPDGAAFERVGRMPRMGTGEEES